MKYLVFKNYYINFEKVLYVRFDNSNNVTLVFSENESIHFDCLKIDEFQHLKRIIGEIL